MAKRLKTIFNKPRPHRFDVFIKSLQNLGRISTTVEQRMFYILVKRKAKEYRSNRVKINPQNGELEWNSSVAIDCKLRQKKDGSWESKVHTFGLFMVDTDEDLCLATAKLDLVDFVGQLRSSMSLEFQAADGSPLTRNPTVDLIVSCILIENETSHHGFHSHGPRGAHSKDSKRGGGDDPPMAISNPVWTDGPSGGALKESPSRPTTTASKSTSSPPPSSPSDKASWKSVKLRRSVMKPRFNGGAQHGGGGSASGADSAIRPTAKSVASHFSPSGSQRSLTSTTPRRGEQRTGGGVARLQRHGRNAQESPSPSPPLDDAPSQPDGDRRSATPSLPPEIQPPNPPQGGDYMSTTTPASFFRPSTADSSSRSAAANTRPPLTALHPSFTQPPLREFVVPVSPRDRLSTQHSRSARNLRTSAASSSGGRRSKGSVSGRASPRSSSVTRTRSRHGRDRSFSDGGSDTMKAAGRHFTFAADDDRMSTTQRSSTSARASPRARTPRTPRSPYASESRRNQDSSVTPKSRGDSSRSRQASRDREEDDDDGDLPPPTPEAPAPLPSGAVPDLPPPSANGAGGHAVGGGESDDESSDDEDQVAHERDVASMMIGRTRDYRHTTPQELLERESTAILAPVNTDVAPRMPPSVRTRVQRTESESEHLMFSPPKELAPVPFAGMNETTSPPPPAQPQPQQAHERRMHTQPQPSAAAAAALRENAHDAMRFGESGGAGGSGYDIDLNRSVRPPDEPDSWTSQANARDNDQQQPAASKSSGMARHLSSGLAKALRNAVQGNKGGNKLHPPMERSMSAREISRSDFSEPSHSAPRIPRGGGARGPSQQQQQPQHMSSAHGGEHAGMLPQHMQHQQQSRLMMGANGRSVSAAASSHMSRMNRGGPLQVHGGLEHASAIHQSNVDPFHPGNHPAPGPGPGPGVGGGPGGGVHNQLSPHPMHGIPPHNHNHNHNHTHGGRISSPLSPLDFSRGMGRAPMGQQQPYSLSRSASSASNMNMAAGGKDPFEGVDLTSFMSLPHRYKSAYHQVSSGQNVLKRSAKFLQRLRKMQEQFAAQVELLTKTELEKCRKESTDTSSPFFIGTMEGLHRLGEIVALRSKMDAQHLLRISEPFKQYQLEVDPRYAELTQRENDARRRIAENAKDIEPRRKEVQPIIDRYLQARKRARLNPSWTADLLPEETKTGTAVSRHQSPHGSPLTTGANSNKSDLLLAQAAARLAAQQRMALPSATVSEPEIVGTSANRQNLQITHRTRQEALRACQNYEKALNPVRDMEKTMRQVELPDILFKMQQIEESRMELLKDQISSLEELFGTVDTDHYPYPLSDTDLIFPDTLKDITTESQVKLFVRRTLEKHGLAKNAKSAYPHELGVDSETLMRENERYEQYQRYCHSRAILEIGEDESHETLDELVEETWYRAYLKSPKPSSGGESVTNRKNREQKLLDDSISKALKDVNNPRLTSISLYLLPNTRPELYFAHFLQKSFCHENIEFYHAATRWLDDETLLPSQRTSLQNKLFETYLNEEAQSMVNLPYKCHQAIVAARETDDADALVRAIREAQHEVVALMSVDSFRKFLKSKIFLSFLQQEVDRLSLQEKHRRYQHNLKLSGLG